MLNLCLQVQNDLEHLKNLLSGQITVDSSLISNLFSPEDQLSSLFGSGTSSPGAGIDILGRLTPTGSGGGGGGMGGAKLPIGMELSPSGAGGGGADNFILTSPSRGPDGSSAMADEPPFDLLGEDDELAMAAPSDGGGLRKQESVLNTPNDILNTPVVFQGDINESPFMRSIRKSMKK